MYSTISPLLMVSSMAISSFCFLLDTSVLEELVEEWRKELSAELDDLL
jgi:hypothetical protein